MTNPDEPRRMEVRVRTIGSPLTGTIQRSRFRANPHETAEAFGALLAFLLYAWLAVFHPSDDGGAGTVVQVFPLVVRWLCFASFGIGGALVFHGLGRPQLSAEIAGLLVLTGGLAIYVLAVLVFLGPRAAVAGGPLLVGFMVANLVRARDLVRNRDVVTIDGDGELRVTPHRGP